MMYVLLAFALAAPPEFTVVDKTAPKFVVVNKTKAPGVAKAKAATFRNGDWHDGHNCPACGRQQLQISSGFSRGLHRHTCRGCGASWEHRG